MKRFQERKFNKHLKKLEKVMGVPIDDEQASILLAQQCVEVNGFFILKDIYPEYLRIVEGKLPVGYTWMDIEDLKWEYIDLKNGQAAKGDIKSRMRFETRGKKIIIDLIQHESFSKKGFDQKLNKEIQSDYIVDFGIEVKKGSTVATRENVTVPRSLIFDFHQLKRNTLSRLTGEKISKSKFHPSVSHEDCLYKVNKNTRKFFLLDCVMRFGKSFIFYEYIKRKYSNNGKVGKFVVFCHDTKTVSGWIKKKEIYYPEFDHVELKKDKTFDWDKPVNKPTIIFISQQLLDSNKDRNLDESSQVPFKDLVNLKVKSDETFVDEVHNYFSPKWKLYFESVTKGQVIIGSGTAAKIKLAYLDCFDEENTHTDTLQDLKNRLYQDYNISVNTTIKRINIEDLGLSKVNLSNLQDSENGKLVYPNQVNKLWESLFNGFRTSPMTPDSITPHNPINCPILCDRVEFAQSGFNYLQNNPQLGIVPIMVAGSQKNRTVKDEDELNEFISVQNSRGKSTAMFTCGSLIQGVSQPEWWDLINLSVTKTYESFYQFFGRGWEIDVLKYQGKKVDITMWDYDPHRTLVVASEFIVSIAMSNGESIKKALKLYFQIHNIMDFVPRANSFRDVDINDIELDIRKEIDKQIFKRGCAARLVMDTSPELIEVIPTELLETLLKRKNNNNVKKKLKKLESYKGAKEKAKTNHYEKTNTSDIPNIPEIRDLWTDVIDGLDTITKRIPIVAEVLYDMGIIKNKDINELMSKSQDELFMDGFQLPNKHISNLLSDHILKYGNKIKINTKIANEDKLIPSIDDLDLPQDKFFKKCEEFDKIYNYGGDDTQLSVRDAYKLLKEELKSLSIKKDSGFYLPYVKSGALNLALAYLLNENSQKLFGKKLTKTEVLEKITYKDDSIFFESIASTMGFIKTNIKKDFIIINPPYKGKELLHLKIFLESFKRLNNNGLLICLHPSTQILNGGDGNITKDFRRILKEYDTTITLIDGNKLFNAGFFTPLSVTKVRKTKDTSIKLINKYFDDSNNEVIDIKDIEDIYVHPSKSVISIRNKIVGKMKEPITEYLYRTGYTKGSHYIKFVTVSGHPPVDNKINPDFYQMLYKANQHDVNDVLTIPKGRKNNGGIYNELGFNSIEQANNGFYYLKTKFVRFCLSLKKTGQNLNLCDMEYIPYMNFDEVWDDKRLFDYFDFTDEEINFIDSFIGDWYESDIK